MSSIAVASLVVAPSMTVADVNRPVKVDHRVALSVVVMV